MTAEQIESEIDKVFNEIFLMPRKKLVTDFLINFLSSDFKFREDNIKINVISLFMYAPSPISFLFIEPNHEYYLPDNTVNRPELSLSSHSYIEVDQLCLKVLDENKIDYSKHLNSLGELDPAVYWENQSLLERNFLLDCWKTAKETTDSELLGFLEYSDFAGGVYDLDSGHCISDDNLEANEYLESKNIFFEKEL